MTTAATATYTYRATDALPLYALKRRKAQKQRGFRAKSTYGHCIKDEVLIDPTSGSGSLLISIGNSVSKYLESGNNIKYYAQELKENTYNLTRMNLVMRGIIPSNIVTRNGDTLEEDWPYFDESNPTESYDPLYVDAVVSNPPYSQAWNPAGKENDPRYKRYGVAPKGKADYAFLLHDLYHVKPDGIITIVLPHGVLFRGGEEGKIRTSLIEYNNIDAIIGLPPNIFFGTGIPTIVMVLKKRRSNTDVLIVDASKGFEKVGKNNKLRSCDIKKIVDAVTDRATVNKFSRLVTRDEIRQNDYNLNIPRYVDSSEKPENWDIYASMFGGIPAGEINELNEYWTTFPNLQASLFKDAGSEYIHFSVDDIGKAVKNHGDIKMFENRFATAFDGFDQFLDKELIADTENVSISKEESVLSAHIFSCLSDIPLVDRYEAYQLLDDEWTRIAIDLEIIQTEGFESVKKVDPNMVTKKKNNKETEVQDGWIGHILPFDLVQSQLFSEDLKALRQKEERMSEIASEWDELLDELPEDEKEKEFINEDKTAFVPAAVKKAIKAKEVEPEVLTVLKKYEKLNNENKKLKKEIKTEGAELQMKTKDQIETLTNDQAYDLLREKWIVPVVNGMKKLPDNIVDAFIKKLENLSEKYETTFYQVEQEISEAESSLKKMIDQLTGDEFDMKGLDEFKKLLGGE